MKGSLIDISTKHSCELAPVTIIGRNSECHLRIDDPRVSRRHAMIRSQDKGFWFYDLGSFNGSLLNGGRVTTTQKLRHGDTLQIADHSYRFEQDDQSVHHSEDDTIVGTATIALIRSTKVLILVSDIRGFTALSESLPPDELARTIGQWYRDSDQILTKHGATVDKFIGDSVLAYWTSTSPDQRIAALKACEELLQSCKQIYSEHQATFDQIGQDFSSGIALHMGEVAYGGMSHSEFTLVGDPVNLTFRLEGLTRDLNQSVLASSVFFENWPEGADYKKDLGSHQVKGRAKPVQVCAITSFPNT
ncbi:MAG: adenylate/guanylate cyclase domain-containing protein [Verrucomicrobiales bacterium]|nr:adenylate/guanylate cyclase domain-containing protein [Verrucomicrobiales bacterium]